MGLRTSLINIALHGINRTLESRLAEEVGQEALTGHQHGKDMPALPTLARIGPEVKARSDRLRFLIASGLQVEISGTRKRDLLGRALQIVGQDIVRQHPLQYHLGYTSHAAAAANTPLPAMPNKPALHTGGNDVPAGQARTTYTNVIPNFQRLPDGNSVRCRHLVEQWMENESALSNLQDVAGTFTPERMGLLQARYREQISRTDCTRQTFQGNQFGAWLHEMAKSLTIPTVDEQVRLYTPGHEMGLKVSVDTSPEGEKKVFLKIYDPDMGQTIIHGPMPMGSLQTLTLNHFLPKSPMRYSDFGKPGEMGVTASYRNGTTSSPALAFVDTADLNILNKIFKHSLLPLDRHLFDELSSKLMHGDPVHARLALLEMVISAEESPLCSFSEYGYQSAVFHRIVDMMNKCGMRGEDAAQYLNAHRLESNGNSFMTQVIANQNPQAAADLFQALGKLGISKKDAIGLLAPPGQIGNSPLHNLALNPSWEKFNSFFQWIKDSGLNSNEIKDMLRDPTILQVILSVNATAASVGFVLHGLEQCGLSRSDIHQLLSRPDAQGYSLLDYHASKQLGSGGEGLTLWLNAKPSSTP